MRVLASKESDESRCMDLVMGTLILTDFAVQELLFHLSDEVDLIENLKFVGGGDLASDILTSVTQLFSSDPMAVFKLTEDVNEESQAI
jgi:hypothetical protein